MKITAAAFFLLPLFLFALPVGLHAQSFRSFSKPLMTHDKINQWQKPAMILAGGGAVMVITGWAIPRGKPIERYPNCIQDCKNVNDDLKSVLVIGGAASLLASIPLFVISSTSKQGAVFVRPRVQKQEAQSVKRSLIYPEISLKVNF